MKRGTAKGLIGAGILLVSGILLGVSIALILTERKIDRIITESKLSNEDWIVQTLTRKLELSNEQKNSVRSSYAANEIERQLARIKARPYLNHPAYLFLEGIQRDFTPEQREKLAAVILDAINANRPPCLSKLTVVLNLSSNDRVAFDGILASHALDEDVKKATMDETCLALFAKSAPEMRSVLGDARMASYESYREELSKSVAAKAK